MDRSYGSDDWISAREEARVDEALERWHERHEFPEDWADDCHLCEEQKEQAKEETDG